MPRITWGPGTVESLKRWTSLPLDIHLMIMEPEKHIDAFIAAGADIITVHAEACLHLHSVIDRIKGSGVKAGVAINPATSVIAIESTLHWLDQVLVMTVNPGLPGQVYISGIERKIKRICNIMDKRGINAEVEVDGGINYKTAPTAVAAGARILVAGSAVYNKEASVADSISRIRG